MNRAILADMLGDEYEIIEAENGVEAISMLSIMGNELSIILLDIVMPQADGFEVLKAMNQHRWIEDIPVVMISAENAPDTIERAYELGVSDFISRPFDAMIVKRRVVNTILLYAKQRKLVGLVADQIYEKERQNNLMIDILSHIMGFRNGESAQHVHHVRIFTDLLVKDLMRKKADLSLNLSNISKISTASALHDIGKMGIPEEILNKPGKLTAEEFEIMKTHSMIGAQMLRELPVYNSEPLVKTAYEICRWHHERYDGGGYPDGLKGDEIPIAAQIVALADVYDALTSDRSYKKAFSHEQAISMILNGECGIFNPVLLECLKEIDETLQKETENRTLFQTSQREIQNVAEEMLQHRELNASERTLQLLEQERMKNSFYATLTHDIQFECTADPSVMTISAWGAESLGLDEVIMEPLNNPKMQAVLGEKGIETVVQAVSHTTPENPVSKWECQLSCKGEMRWFQIAIMSMWTRDEEPVYTGIIGKAIDIHDSRMKMDTLEKMATHDPLTGLFNHAHAKKKIMERMAENHKGQFALAIIDLDYFKSANDKYGHMFGDQVLIYLSDLIHQSIRSNDIAVRVGGDEFLVFLDYKFELEPIIERIFDSIYGKQYKDFRISISMGVSRSPWHENINYEELFHQADQALYSAKQNGRGKFFFYDNSMDDALSAISNIEGNEQDKATEV
ncbi:MAG: diguanylate cyclase [Firmicutes bacterium]|nr:diguanylate cyclase [Bacillota bacterium]